MAASSEVKGKERRGEDLKEVSHEHRFYIQFESRDKTKHEIDRKAFQTVIEAIRSVPQYAALGWSDQNLVIQRTAGDHVSTVATHFPCCLIKEKENLIIYDKTSKVEETEKNSSRKVLTEESYILFYISDEVAQGTVKKDVFISGSTKLLGRLCVYGEKGITAKEALERDGRFKPFTSFSLIGCDAPDANSSTVIDELDKKTYMIKLPKLPTPRKKVEPDRRTEGSPDVSTTVSAVSSSGDSNEEIKTALFLEGSPADSSQKEMSVREENVSKVLRFTELTKIGKLVCKVVVGGVTGTGFVLIDNYIMTSARLFETCTDGDRLREGADVEVQFNYENPQTGQYISFKVEEALICSIEAELDYAVLVVNHESFTQFIQTPQTGDDQIPSGLLERVGQMPENGEACIIGHPEGEVKQIHMASVIEIEKRRQAVLNNLLQYKGNLYFHFVDQVKTAGIEKILMGGDRAEEVLTYSTFMRRGASGSPVFDAQGFLCGLHTSGFVFGFKEPKESAIEFANSMKTVITHLVKKLHEPNQEKLPGLLERMEAVGENDVLREIFGSVAQPKEL